MADGLKTLNPHTDAPGEPADAKPAGQWRRSVYLLARRYYPLGFLETFDAPIMQTNCSRRMNSVSPLQSLTLMNDDFVVGKRPGLCPAGRRPVQRRSGRSDRKRLSAGSLPPALAPRKHRSPERICPARRISISKPTPRRHRRRRKLWKASATCCSSPTSSSTSTDGPGGAAWRGDLPVAHSESIHRNHSIHTWSHAFSAGPKWDTRSLRRRN